MCMCVCLLVCMCAHNCTGTWGGPKKDPLKLELHMVVGYLMWVLGIEPQS